MTTLAIFAAVFATWIFFLWIARRHPVPPEPSQFAFAVRRFEASVVRMEIAFGEKLLPAAKRASEALAAFGRAWAENSQEAGE